MSKTQDLEAASAAVVRHLREERERQNISMTALAERAGLSQASISLIERDLRNPTLDTLFRISQVLGVELGAVITQATRPHGKQRR